jgi:glucose-6-phosphate isomerase
MLKIDLTYTDGFLAGDFLAGLVPRLTQAQEKIMLGTGAGAEFLGWRDWPTNYDQEELRRIQNAASQMRGQASVLVVLGIGGSYLGARAALEFLKSPFYNQLPGKALEVYFAGNNLSGQQLEEILTLIGERDFCVNVISKSGTTLEPALAFRFFRAALEKKYGAVAAGERIYATTDKTKGVLKTIAGENHYQTFVIPDEIGGRYSVLTAVGLLPLAAAGVEIEALLAGAKQAQTDLTVAETSNPAWQYAGARYLLGEQGKTLEVLGSYEPRLSFVAKWWQQLFGESEGKDGQGIFPVSVDFTTDLHSLGQYLQQGKRQLFETVLWLDQVPASAAVTPAAFDDGLAYLQGQTLAAINEKAFLGTLKAHRDGGVPEIVCHLPDVSETTLGYLLYFFEFACALSAYLTGVNPFDQPGVEAYKTEMKKLLTATPS